MRPLGAPEIIDYLAHRLPGRDRQLRPTWRAVADALRAEEPLLSVLASPWHLFLAVTAYSTEDSDPGELLAMTPEQADAHLLANLIPAVIRNNETAARNDWTAGQVTRWLAAIAGLGAAETDIRLSDLWRISRSRYPRWAPALLAGSAPALIGLWLLAVDQIFAWVSAALFLCAALVILVAWSASSPMTRIDLHALSTPDGRRRFTVGLARWLTAGLALGFLTWALLSPFFGMMVVLIVGIEAGLAVGLQSEVTAASAPSILVRQCLTYTAVTGSTIGLSFALPIGLVFGVTDGLAAGLTAGLISLLVFGLTFGLMLGKGRVWLRYALAVRSAQRDGLLPTRPAIFLDWCLDAGLMRMAGSAVQFRHRRLQDSLLTTGSD